MKRIFLVATLLTFFWLMSSQVVLGQDATSSASVEKYHITFPIAQLNNCANLDECKAYCNIPANLTACQAYAKTKGFYKQDTSVSTAAKQELGCTFGPDCQQFCSKSENFDKCKAFGEKFLKINQKNLTSINTTQNSATYCVNFCSSNPQACSQGPGKPPPATGSATTNFVGPGGCTSSLTCSNYCKDHKDECANFNTRSLAHPGLTTEGPPGQNPSNTGGLSQLESVCRASGCSWSNFTCTCQPPQPKPTLTTTSRTSTTSAGVEGVSIGPSWISKFITTLFGN